MDKHFTHLHLHSEFSLLDGAISLDNLVSFGKKNNFKALAITDHGNIFGAVKFFQKCKAAGIKPILGMEAYFTEDCSVKSVEKKYYHLVLLVQNEQGYKNLCKLISYSYQQGFYFKPRIDYAMLEKHAEGLIVTTACLGGHIPQLLMHGQYEEAERYADWFIRVFGKDRFFLEVQPEDQEDQKKLNPLIFALAEKKGLKCIATGDCHYVHKEDHEAHEIMLCIQTHNKITDPDRFSFGDCRAYMRTTEEMLAEFPGHEDAIWNAGLIADMCTFDFETGKLFFPQFEVPEGHTPETYFKYLCLEGFETLIHHKRIEASERETYQARLDLEMDLIINMGFVGYFLIVSDFIRWSKRNNIPVGPGRGSAAGSLVAWTLEITNIDPIKYNLLFERFLNPERITMPDIDIDFCIEGRETVIQHIRDKYGHEKVGQIITFGTMLAKGVIKDVARVLGFPFEDANALTDLIPDQLKISLDEAFEQEPRLQDLINANSKVKKLFDVAHKLEGLTRHASKHAAGVVISPEPIDAVLPVYVPPKTTELVTQYAMTELESLGFLKIDLLGLKNLTLIKKVLDLIKKNHNITIDIDHIPLDDPQAFMLLCEGKTSGVFQLESEGIKDVLRRLKPEKFEDIIAVNALYRPGPLGSGMVDDFIDRRHGRAQITYLFNELAPILQETYGVIVYQEQVMKIASAIGGYSLGEADILRRAMGKKKADVMAQQRKLFTERAVSRGFDGKKAGELFDLMEYFAGYGFNKSHSAAYALIAYQTAYLKALYPAEFMACLISLEAADAEKMVFYIEEAKEMGIDIIPPDINRSDIDFTVQEGALIFGLIGIKNVGHTSLENILKERSSKPFKDLLDFCSRIDLRTTNKRVLENLICAGAFDQLPGNRAQKYHELPTIMERAQEKKEALATGQMGLFMVQATTEESVLYEFQPLAEWSSKEKLEKEKSVIGFYLSSHPLDTYKKEIEWLRSVSFADAFIRSESGEKDQFITSFGIVKSKKEITTKKGDRMAFLMMEDKTGSAEIILFPKTYAAYQELLEHHDTFIVRGFLDETSVQKCKIKANDLIPIDEVFKKQLIKEVQCTLPQPCYPALLEQMNAIFTEQQKSDSFTAKLAIHFYEQDKRLMLKASKEVCLTKNDLIALYRLNIAIACVL